MRNILKVLGYACFFMTASSIFTIYYQFDLLIFLRAIVFALATWFLLKKSETI